MQLAQQVGIDPSRFLRLVCSQRHAIECDRGGIGERDGDFIAQEIQAFLRGLFLRLQLAIALHLIGKNLIHFHGFARVALPQLECIFCICRRRRHAGQYVAVPEPMFGRDHIAHKAGIAVDPVDSEIGIIRNDRRPDRFAFGVQLWSPVQAIAEQHWHVANLCGWDNREIVGHLRVVVGWHIIAAGIAPAFVAERFLALNDGAGFRHATIKVR